MITIAKNDGPFNYVLKLSNVAGPRIRLKKLHAFLIDRSHFLSQLGGISINEIFREQRDIFFPFTQRGNINGENINSIEKIRPKSAGLDRCLEITIRCSYNPHIRSNRLRPTDSAKLSFLKNAQQRYLRFHWQFTDFIQKNRPSLRQFKVSGTTLERACEGSFLMPKQLRCNQRLRNGRAIYTDKGAPGARR